MPVSTRKAQGKHVGSLGILCCSGGYAILGQTFGVEKGLYRARSCKGINGDQHRHILHSPRGPLHRGYPLPLNYWYLLLPL